jgi:hypothetical protein
VQLRQIIKVQVENHCVAACPFNQTLLDLSSSYGIVRKGHLLVLHKYGRKIHFRPENPSGFHPNFSFPFLYIFHTYRHV